MHLSCQSRAMRMTGCQNPAPCMLACEADTEHAFIPVRFMFNAKAVDMMPYALYIWGLRPQACRGGAHLVFQVLLPIGVGNLLPQGFKSPETGSGYHIVLHRFTPHKIRAFRTRAFMTYIYIMQIPAQWLPRPAA